MGDTKSIGIAYRDQDLDGSTIRNATIINATVNATTTTTTALVVGVGGTVAFHYLLVK